MTETRDRNKWLNENLIDTNMEGFSEYMKGSINSKLFEITDDFNEYNPDDLLLELNNILDINDPRNDQVHITNVPGHENDTRYSHGSLVVDLSKTKDEIMPDGSRKLIPVYYDTPIAEESFSSISNIFKDTIFSEMAQKLQSRYRLGRFRVMIQPRSHCLSWHVDAQPRIHYPLKTQKGCFMIVNGEMRHLEVGNCYKVDTRQYHTAVNASRENRIHLVANILE